MARLPRLADTIAAIATGLGRAGVGIVRVSGRGAAEIACRVTGKVPAPRVATLASFRGDAGDIIDQGLALYFPGPHSYTGEDVLELHGHGSPVALQLLLRACLSAGARIAEPGEFTRRAFEHGKLDLAQAESVADLIDASTEKAARSAARSLAGVFSAEVRRLAADLVELRALIEATLDFPEEEAGVLREHDVPGRMAALREALARVHSKARQGSLLRAGLHVVLAGRPNVGKSSLLNRLAGDERAIVTEIAGTTRDALREAIQIDGVPLHVIDTAGLHESDDPLERIGMERAWQEIGRADAVLLMADARDGVSDAEREIWRKLPHSMETITVLNKVDLTQRSPHRASCEFGPSVSVSARTGAGIELLQQELLRTVGWQGTGEDAYIARERHLRALQATGAHLARVAESFDRLELVAEELRLAHESLGEITGEVCPDDLLGEIFSRFCIGK